MLPPPEEVAGASEGEVGPGDLEAVGGFAHDAETFLCLLALVVRQQDAGGLVGTPADPPPQLMQLGKAEPFRVLDEHDDRVRHVDTDFDDDRRHKKLDVALQELLHDVILLGGFHLSVQKPDPVVLERAFRDLVIVFRGGDQFFGLPFLNQRTDDVPLPPLVEELFDVSVRPLPYGGVDAVGLDGLSPLREFVDDGDIEVSVNGKGQGPRDGSGRHDHDMGPFALFGQRASLAHSEPVLLVRDDEAQFIEPDVFGQEGMCADDEIDVPVSKRCLDALLLRRRRAAGQEFDRDAGVPEEVLHGREVLFREDLGRRHHGGLVPVLRRHIDERGSDHRLAGTDVALDEAIHEEPALHVLYTGFHRTLLSARGFKGQEPVELFGTVVPQDDVRPRLVVLPQHAHAELEVQQLFKNESPPGLHHPFHRGREVDLLQRLFQREEAVLFPEVIGQGLFGKAPVLGEGFFHAAFDVLRRHVFRGAIDGPDAALLPDVFDVRRQHLPHVPFEGHLAVEEELFAGFQFGGRILVVEDEDLHGSRGIEHSAFEDRDAASGAEPGRCRPDGGPDTHFFLRQFCSKDGDRRRPVLIGPRVAMQKVVNGMHIEPFELFDPFRTDALQCADIVVHEHERSPPF